jgi:ligand-binding sensor domain-containing protein
MSFIGLSVSSFGQQHPQYNIENISTEIIKLEKGLSQNSVRCIFEDHKGYMWFGTWDGLNRYDGTKFLSFSPNNTNTNNSLVQQTVNALIQDEHDRIWVATDGGLSRIDYKTLNFTNFSMLTVQKSDTIHAIYQDTSDYIWIGTQYGIALINRKNDSLFPIERIYAQVGILKNAEIRVIKQINNILWIGTGDGLFKINFLSSKELEVHKISNLTDNHITTILQLNDSFMFVGTELGLNKISLINNSVENLKVDNESTAPNSNVIMTLLLDENNKIWVGTSGKGIYLYQASNKKFTPFVLKPSIGGHFNKKQAEYDPYINCLYQSRDGIIWAGMAWRGIMKINEKQNIFKSFQKNILSKKGLNDNHIWCFNTTDSTLLIGTESGVNIYNYWNHKFSYLTKKNGLSSNQIRSIHISSDSCIWIGTYKGGLNRYKPATGEITIFKSSGTPQHYISDNTVWSILEDNQQQLWFGTYNGLNRYNMQTGEMKVYYSHENDSNSISHNIIYCSLLDSNQHIWFGTYKGLNEYNPKTDQFTRFEHIAGQKESLSNNRIFSIYDDLNGNLWVGTVGGGLNKFNKETHQVKWYTTEQGLPNNVVYAIIPDKHENIWLSTNNGICRYNLNDESTICYSVNDGLLSNELNKGAAMSDLSGNIYFGGMFGFNVFSPDKIVKNTLIPKIAISSFEAYNTNPIYDVNSNEIITLDYTQNDFSVRYAVLDFTNPQKNLYKHRLIGYDRDWVSTDAFYPIASYSRMEPGRYTFQVMGANNDGIWNPEPFSIHIRIRPPWYYRPIFFIPMIILILVIIFLIVRSRILHFKNQHAIEKQILNMERQALRLQMNPHFIFNTLNSIQAFILKNKTKESIAYLSKFSRLVRAILNTSKETLLSLDDEINILNNYLELEQLRFEHRFDFEIKTSPKIDTEFLGIAPMLIQPYVENAVIHGVGPLKERKGEIIIKFDLEKEFIRCSISDNGVGRSYHQKKDGHKSKGMRLTKERLKILNRQSQGSNTVEVIDLFDNESKAIGTRIILFITFEEL